MHARTLCWQRDEKTGWTHSRRKDRLDALAAEIQANAGTTHVLELDVYDRPTTSQTLAQMAKKLALRIFL